jgi:hypothetical protein
MATIRHLTSHKATAVCIVVGAAGPGFNSLEPRFLEGTESAIVMVRYLAPLEADTSLKEPFPWTHLVFRPSRSE